MPTNPNPTELFLCRAAAPQATLMLLMWCLFWVKQMFPAVRSGGSRAAESGPASCFKVISVPTQFNYVAAEEETRTEERGVNELADGSHSLSTQNTLLEHPLQPTQQDKCVCVINEQEHLQSLLHTQLDVWTVSKHTSVYWAPHSITSAQHHVFLSTSKLIPPAVFPSTSTLF